MALVKEYLSQDFTQLDPVLTVAQAIEQLGREQKTYGVVRVAGEELAVLVTAGMLRRAPDLQASVGNFAKTLPSLAPVKRNDVIEQVVRRLANALVSDPKLAGLIVQDDQEVIGIVSRPKLVEIAGRVITRGGDASRLEGASSLLGVYYYCPVDGEEKLVSYYNPANPPRCRQGHLMKRKPRPK
ncbi:MAG: hypothetical protein U0350_22030 [Caldilineaceae bacterium]